MPITLPSHQAPALALKRAFPGRLCGTALVVGSAAPDLEYFLRGEPYRELGHSLPGQLTFCLPLTLLLVWLITRVLARPLALHCPHLDEFRLRDYRLLDVTSRRPGYWRQAVPSALAGSFSHVLWDACTHDHGWVALSLGYSARRVGGFPVPALLQHASTLVGGAATVWLLWRLGRERALERWAGAEAAAAPTQHPTLWSVAALGLCPGLFAATGAMSAVDQWGIPDLRFGWWFYWLILLRAVSLGFVGLCFGCWLAGRWMKPPPAPTPDLAPDAGSSPTGAAPPDGECSPR